MEMRLGGESGSPPNPDTGARLPARSRPATERPTSEIGSGEEGTAAQRGGCERTPPPLPSCIWLLHRAWHRRLGGGEKEGGFSLES